MARKQTRESFWAKVKKTKSCWEWQKSCNNTAMIGLILELLKTSDVYNVSEVVDIANANIASAAAIADTKLGTISTANKVQNSATTATSSNSGSAIVSRDSSGNFSAGVITANVTGALTGNASTATTLATGRDFQIVGDVEASAQSFKN